LHNASTSRCEKLDVTIAEMAKFKPVRAKSKSSPTAKGGLPCVILLASGIALVLLFVYLVLKNANG
jgi:hypothetical protein